MNGLKFLVNAGSPEPTITRQVCALAFAARGTAVFVVEPGLAPAIATTTSAASTETAPIPSTAMPLRRAVRGGRDIAFLSCPPGAGGSQASLGGGWTVVPVIF